MLASSPWNETDHKNVIVDKNNNPHLLRLLGVLSPEESVIQVLGNLHSADIDLGGSGDNERLSNSADGDVVELVRS